MSANQESIYSIIKKAFTLLNSKERRNFYKLAFLVLLLAFTEILSIASILPFMSVLSNPEIIKTNELLNTIYIQFNFSSERYFLIFLGLIVIVSIILTNLFKIYVSKKNFNYVFLQSHKFACKLLNDYLSKDYEYFLNKNSTEISKNILTEVYQVIHGIFFPIIEIFSRFILVFFITILLFYVNSNIAIVSILFFTGSYYIIYNYFKNEISILGEKRNENTKLRFKTISETIGGIKEIKLLGHEEFYIKKFETASLNFSNSMAKNSIIGDIPRYIMEILAFAGMMLIPLYALTLNQDISTIIPLLSIYAFAGYKLMPAMQRIYSSISKIKFSKEALYELHNVFSINKYSYNMQIEKNNSVLKFQQSIELSNVDFKYLSANEYLFKNFNMKIKANTTVAFIGTTGSGKTTLIDLILGLLQPSNGSLKVDGLEVTSDNLNEWQNNIAYVPQFIYLSDTTIQENIAFGEEDIDFDKVRIAAKIACIDEFIESLSEGYKTVIGERGARISGGQRQRIGLARAFYRNPKLLILDEATNALDEDTEKQIIDAVYNFSKGCTIIMIAHRLSTIERADEIIDISKIK